MTSHPHDAIPAEVNVLMNSDMSQSSPASSDATPVSLSRDGDAAITITWSDGKSTRWTAARLRQACPCATCREKRRKEDDSVESDQPSRPAMLPVLSQAEARPLRIESMSPVGSYAYNIAFSDGHSSGIFTLAMLHGDGS